jgi:hypothetical protein
MWKRFGTATGIAASGTEEEFRLTYECWESFGRLSQSSFVDL